MVFDDSCSNQRIWFHNSPSAKIVNVVYNFFNHKNLSNSSIWERWHIPWRIHVAPRVKTFMSRLYHGCIPTFEFFYNFNLGP